MSVNRFQRMVGIPEDEYLHLKSLQQSNNPLQGKFMSLSSEYNQQGHIPNPEIRVQRQGETLNQMINVKEEMRKRLVSATPKPYQSRVQSLFQFMSDKIAVNARGEIYGDDGSVIQDSNISDLIQHAVRDRRRNIIPEGWDMFVNILRDNNAPRMMLNYETLEELAQVRKPMKIKNERLSRRDMAPKSKLIQRNLMKKSPKSIVTRIRRKPDYFIDHDDIDSNGAKGSRSGRGGRRTQSNRGRKTKQNYI